MYTLCAMHIKKMSASVTYRKLEAVKVTADFRDAVRVVSVREKRELDANEVEVDVRYVGVNASDVNFTNGKYVAGIEPPFDVGFECVGVVRRCGSASAKQLAVGTPVAYVGFGAYAERLVVDVGRLTRVPVCSELILPLLVSGVTASLAFAHAGDLFIGDEFEYPNRNVAGQRAQTVLVTAAAGATGHLAVQLAKRGGHHVIGTCSSDEKAQFLRELGCDRVINYRRERLGDVLRAEYKRGVDVVYESVGGSMFRDAVDNLARHGRLVIIGMISEYESSEAWSSKRTGSVAPAHKLLGKSASVRGFFLNDFAKHTPSHASALGRMIADGSLVAAVDRSRNFQGLESIVDAVESMYRSKNIGKVFVSLAQSSRL
jgi:prostaglandin reductase 3